MTFMDKTVRRATSPKVRNQVVERQGGRCAHCGSPLDCDCQIDHDIPLWCGGSNDIDNLQALDPACHKIKNRHEATIRAKVKRVKAKHEGTYPPPRHPLRSRNRLGSRDWLKKVDGTVIRREA